MINWQGITVPNSSGAEASDLVVDAQGKCYVVCFNKSTNKYQYYEYAPIAVRAARVKTLARGMEAGILDVQTATPEANRPALALTPAGDIWFGYSVVTGQGKVVRLKRQSPGLGWSAPTQVGSGWQVDLAADAQGNVHVVWGIAGRLNYAKYDPAGNLALNPLVLPDSPGYGPSLATDAQGNAHIAWENRAPGRTAAIKYLSITPNGTLGSVAQLSAANSINVSTAVDSTGQLYFTWQQGAQNVFSVALLRLGGAPTIISGQDNAYNPSATTFNTNLYVAYYKTVPSPVTGKVAHKVCVWMGNSVSIVDDGVFPTLRAGANGFLHLTYSHTPAPTELRYRGSPSS